MLTEGRGGAASHFGETKRRLARLCFWPLHPNPPETQKRLAKCLIGIGRAASSPWAALSFLERTGGLLHPGRHAPAAYSFERLIARAVCPMSSPLFFWEQLGGLPRLWFGRFTIQGSGCKRTTLSGCLLLFGSPLFLPKPNDG